jgi:hypothetical protein
MRRREGRRTVNTYHSLGEYVSSSPYYASAAGRLPPGGSMRDEG